MLKNQKIFILCVFALIIQSCGFIDLWKNRNHEIRKSHYNNGTLEYNSSYLNDKLDGPSYHYNLNGILISYPSTVNLVVNWSPLPSQVWKSILPIDFDPYDYEDYCEIENKPI